MSGEIRQKILNCVSSSKPLWPTAKPDGLAIIRILNFWGCKREKIKCICHSKTTWRFLLLLTFLFLHWRRTPVKIFFKVKVRISCSLSLDCYVEVAFTQVPLFFLLIHHMPRCIWDVAHTAQKSILYNFHIYIHAGKIYLFCSRREEKLNVWTLFKFPSLVWLDCHTTSLLFFFFHTSISSLSSFAHKGPTTGPNIGHYWISTTLWARIATRCFWYIMC